MGISLKLSTFDESIYTKEEINKYTNEELVDLIHQTNDNMYWELLYIKTKNCIFKVFNTSVNSYNKDKHSEEIFSVLMQAWIHSVNTYDKEKATGEFYKYSIYIIKQKYIRYASRTNAEKEGVSVKHTYLDDCVYAGKSSVDLSNCNIIDAIEDETSTAQLELVEIKNDIHDNLKKLKKAMPDVYSYIIEYFFENKTYAVIAEKHNVNTITVRRAVKKGLKQLNYYFNVQDKLSI